MTTLNGFDFYGGSTVTSVYDATGANYIACCATKRSNEMFGFYVFKDGIEVPLTPFCTGRGSISNGGWWIAANGKEYFRGQIPGFKPFTSSNSDPRVDALVSQLAAMSRDITAIQTALANISQEAGALDPKDREVIDRWRAFFGM